MFSIFEYLKLSLPILLRFDGRVGIVDYGELSGTTLEFLSKRDYSRNNTHNIELQNHNYGNFRIAVAIFCF